MRIRAFRTGEKERMVDVTASVKPSHGRKATVRVFADEQRQFFQGFGGAITEAAAYVLSKMSLEQRQEVLRSYFSEDGLNYSFVRLPIGSCDFSLTSYSYVDAGDKSLASFSLAHEETYLFPILTQAIAAHQKKLILLSSPWSPCAWMKDNGSLVNGGHLKEDDYPLWADYLVAYVTAMKKEGFDVSYLTLQNEPAAAQTWESCLYSSEAEGRLARILRNKLDQAQLSGVSLFIWDHNRDLLLERANQTLQDPKVDAAVDGIAYHWYGPELFENVLATHLSHPAKHLFFTEGCVETLNPSAKMGSFQNAERYARNIIGDLNAYCEAWIDWNIVLNQEGGPNHVGNFCEAPILFDEKTSVLTFNPSFYGIAHFAHFFVPGGHVIKTECDPSLKALGYRNPNGSLVIVLLNDGDSDRPVVLRVENEERTFVLPKHTLWSLVFAESL